MKPSAPRASIELRCPARAHFKSMCHAVLRVLSARAGGCFPLHTAVLRALRPGAAWRLVFAPRDRFGVRRSYSTTAKPLRVLLSAPCNCVTVLHTPPAVHNTLCVSCLQHPWSPWLGSSESRKQQGRSFALNIGPEECTEQSAAGDSGADATSLGQALRLMQAASR